MHFPIPDHIARYVDDKIVRRDTVGCSGAGVYRYEAPNGGEPALFLKVEPRGGELLREHENLLWLQGKLPVPRVVERCSTEGFHYLLLEEVPGKMACDRFFLERPETCVSLLAAGIRSLWQLDIRACPISNRLDDKLKLARERVGRGLVDCADWEEDTRKRFSSPGELLAHLEDHRPPEDLAFTHGDYCLPNILGEGERLTGLIDMGRAGVADRWQDIALCVRSLDHNFGSRRWEPLLYQLLGVAPDPTRLEYYILLDELF